MKQIWAKRNLPWLQSVIQIFVLNDLNIYLKDPSWICVPRSVGPITVLVEGEVKAVMLHVAYWKLNLFRIYYYIQIHVTWHVLAATAVFHACALLATIMQGAVSTSCLCVWLRTFFHIMPMCGVLSRLLNNKHVCRRILLYITEVSDGNILFIKNNWIYIAKLSPISNSGWSYNHLAPRWTSIVKLPTTVWTGN